jgi:hypothetical protein
MAINRLEGAKVAGKDDDVWRDGMGNLEEGLMRNAQMMRGLLGCVVLLGMMAPGLAQAVEPCAPDDRLTAFDAARIEGLATSRLQGLAAAMADGAQDDRSLVGGLYAQGLAPAGTLAPGHYACRTLKLGGLSPLIVYADFQCTISESDDGGYTIVKSTGSQQLSGTLTPSGDGLLYTGALNYSDESAIDYGADAERDQVGCLYRVSQDDPRLVLELPAPQFESLFDILVLTPR